MEKAASKSMFYIAQCYIVSTLHSFAAFSAIVVICLRTGVSIHTVCQALLYTMSGDNVRSLVRGDNSHVVTRGLSVQLALCHTQFSMMLGHSRASVDVVIGLNWHYLWSAISQCVTQTSKTEYCVCGVQV